MNVEKIGGELKKKPLEKTIKQLKKRGRKKGVKNKIIKITEREIEIQNLISKGLSQSDIAKKLNISRQCVSECIYRSEYDYRCSELSWIPDTFSKF